MTSDLKLSLKLFLSWILLLILFYLLGGIFFGGLNSINLFSLANWDGRHFLEIAEFGYRDKVQYAFFPLYPVLINLVSNILPLNFLFSALLINFLSSFLLILVFLKYLKSCKYENPVKIISLFLIFPTSFYLISAYSESLFLLFALLTFLFAKNKKYLIACLFASASVSIRIAGIAVIFALLTQIYFLDIPKKRKLLYSLIAPLGLISYCTYLFVNTGNPFYFLVSELSWGRGISIPGENIISMISFLVRFGVRPESSTLLSDLLFTVFGVGIALRAFKNLKPAETIYTWSALLLPLATSLLLSVPRFLLVVFPIFIIIAKVKNRIFKICFVIISLTLLFLYFNFFIRNIWVS